MPGYDRFVAGCLRNSTGLLLILVGGLVACGTDARVQELPLVAPLEDLDLDPGLVERIEVARAAVRAAPDSVETWSTLGLVFHANHLLDLAAPCYRQAGELAPDDARWPYQLSLVHSGLGQVDASVEALQAALALAPEEAALYWHLGQIRLDEGDTVAAESAFSEARRLAPGRAGGWRGRARVHLSRGDHAQAIADLEQALRLDPADAFSHHLRTRALRLAGRNEEADREQGRGEGGAPTWPCEWDTERQEHMVVTLAVRRTIAKELYDAGRFDQAIVVLERLNEQLADDLPHKRFLGRTYLRAGRTEDALAAYEQCLTMAPEDRNTLVGLAEAQLRAGRDDEALVTVERTLALHPRFGAAHHFHGVLLKNAGDISGAIAAFRACLQNDQRNLPTHIALGRALLELRRWDEAAATYENALRTNENSGDLHVGLAKARLMQEQLDAAEASLARSHSLRVNDTSFQRKVEGALRRARSGARGS